MKVLTVIFFLALVQLSIQRKLIENNEKSIEVYEHAGNDR